MYTHTHTHQAANQAQSTHVHINNLCVCVVTALPTTTAQYIFNFEQTTMSTTMMMATTRQFALMKAAAHRATSKQRLPYTRIFIRFLLFFFTRKKKEIPAKSLAFSRLSSGTTEVERG